MIKLITLVFVSFARLTNAILKPIDLSVSEGTKENLMFIVSYKHL